MSERAPPDFSTPEGVAAYKQELRGVARTVRLAGIGMALGGFALGLTRFAMTPWPTFLMVLTLILCVAGVVLLAIGMVQRTQYHMRRLAGR
ncbi:MAG: hypothetical protein NW206_16620 [Hyphomonadaceae bacterium]|nr:hypothetical protein [Hyphomonadaceae bacterium]